MSLSEDQIATLALIPKITAPLSMIGSTLVIYVICTKTKQQWKSSPYHRLLLAISSIDILTSFWYALGMVAVPVDTGQPNAKGTFATCQAQGFILTFGTFANQYYASSLMAYFYLTICCNVSQETFTTTYEKYLHVISLGVALLFSVIALLLQVLNWNGNSVCWIAASPPGCEALESIECDRGGNSLIPYLWAVISSMILCLGVFGFCIIQIWIYVRRTSRRASSMTQITQNMTKQVSIQSILYGLAFANTYLLFVVASSIIASGRYDWLESLFPLLSLVQFFFLLQGFFNMLIYLRLRFLRAYKISIEVTTAISKNTEGCGCGCGCGGSSCLWSLWATISYHDQDLSRMEEQIRQERIQQKLKASEQQQQNTITNHTTPVIEKPQQ